MLQNHAQMPGAHGVLEVCITRHKARFNEIVAPLPHPAANDQFSTPWEPAECRWSSGSLHCVWVRRTSQPLQPSAPSDPKQPDPPLQPRVVIETLPGQPEPPPQMVYSQEELDLQELERLITPNVQPAVPSQVHPAPVARTAPPAPPPGPPAVSLPSYARERQPLATQRNVSVRGGPSQIQPEAAPGYVPPMPVAASGGLLASAEVRQYSGPLPPAPTPGGVPPLARPGVAVTVAVQPATMPSASAPSLPVPPTAPPRVAQPEPVASSAPMDRSMFPMPHVNPPAPLQPQPAAPEVTPS